MRLNLSQISTGNGHSKKPGVIPAPKPIKALAAAFVLVLCFTGVCLAADFESAVPETVGGQIFAANGFSWRYGYDLRLAEHKIWVKVAINLIPHNGVTRLELDRVKTKWEAGIEKTWSNQFALLTAAGRRYPILIDVAFKGPRFHHDVIVGPGGGRSNELNWNIMDSAAIAAHEFGHMLGVFDEYRHGATDPEHKNIDVTSIMTSNPLSGKTYARHYQRFLTWFQEKNGFLGVELVSVEIEHNRVARKGAPGVNKD